MLLACATVAGNLPAVKRLLAVGMDIEVPSERSRSAPLLHLAAEQGNAGIVEELLKVGAVVHEKDNSRDGLTALYCAVAAQSDAVVRALNRAGANIDILNAKGLSPLQPACTHGHPGVVVFLLLKRASTEKGWGGGHPPLHLAVINNHPGAIEDLLYAGKVPVGRYDMHGRSATRGVGEKPCEQFLVRVPGSD